MPSWTSQSPDLKGNGPRVSVSVGVSQAAAAALITSGQPVPAAVPANALIDTGASGSVITRDLAQRLGLQPVGVTLVNTPSGTNVQASMYAVRLMLSPTVVFETTATEAESIRAQGLDALIGRDVLSQAVFVYIGYVNQFTIAV